MFDMVGIGRASQPTARRFSLSREFRSTRLYRDDAAVRLFQTDFFFAGGEVQLFAIVCQ